MAEARQRFAGSPVARLATVRPDGRPHLVPIVFAVVADVIITRVDHKPKRTEELQRLANLRHEPRCTLLVDHYGEDWAKLWWVRADGRAKVTNEPPADHRGLNELLQRYESYRHRPPRGPLIEIAVERWSGWRADRST